MRWIERNDLERCIRRSIGRYPVTLLTGPRQCGKTAIARRLRRGLGGAYFDLEDPETPLQPETARIVLGDLRGLVVVDEAQRQPGLFPLIRVLADRRPLKARFLILGSASPDLVRGASESLAGRVSFVDMAGFLCAETGAGNWKRLWLRGGFPRAYLAGTGERSHDWRMNFIQSLLEHDLPRLGIRVPAAALRRFWMMLAHYHGQVWNSADLARAMGVKEDTARHYLDILAGAFMVRQLQPWFTNSGKRLVKAPKIYIRDSGLLHALLGLKSIDQLLSHPGLGFSWEGFALDQVIRAAAAERDSFFYRTHAGAELDLLLFRGARRYGFEFKFADRPVITRSMRVALEDLELHKLWVVYPGDGKYKLDAKIDALPLRMCLTAIEEMR